MGRARDAFTERLPRDHLVLLHALRLTHSCGGYHFVHAGIRLGIRLDRQREEDLLWIREPFLSASTSHGAVVVHGHTIVSRPAVRPNWIAIDTGAFCKWGVNGDRS